jgi:hypothetical protein
VVRTTVRVYEHNVNDAMGFLANADATGVVNTHFTMIKYGGANGNTETHAHLGQPRPTQTTLDRPACPVCRSDENGRSVGLRSVRRTQSVCQTVCLLATLVET